MKRFDEAVFPRAGRRVVDGLDVLLGEPALESLGDKLRPIVGADKFRRTVLGDRGPDQRDHVLREADLALEAADVDLNLCSSSTVSMRRAPPWTVASAGGPTSTHMATVVGLRREPVRPRPREVLRLAAELDNLVPESLPRSMR